MSLAGLFAMMLIGMPVVLGFCWLMANTKLGRKIDKAIFPHGDDGWDDNTMP